MTGSTAAPASAVLRSFLYVIHLHRPSPAPSGHSRCFLLAGREMDVSMRPIACHLANATSVLQVEEGQPKEAHVTVASEDTPERLLLETKICKGDGFQKQQGRLP